MKKIAVVTGGGSGIGQAAALELQKSGFNIFIVGRREEELMKTVKLSEVSDYKIIPFPADITNSNDVKSLFSKIKNDFGRIDVLFNNAGMGAPRVPIEDLKEDDWRKVVDVNLTGSFLCAQQAVKLMKEQDPMGGRIINNGSISAHAPRPDTIAYTATKHAVTGLTKSLALDGRNFGITASQIDIGNADTAIGSRFKSGVPQANGEMMIEPVFESIDCGKAVAYIANLPKGTNILNLTIMASNMPFVGRG
jgi:NAD(P)-dependent dehydrogenase (short-subunit alcohol dehydrogenase family)